jgi:hypothetical protein
MYRLLFSHQIHTQLFFTEAKVRQDRNEYRENQSPCSQSRWIYWPPSCERAYKERGYWIRGADIKYVDYKASSADEFKILDLRRWNNCLQD